MLYSQGVPLEALGVAAARRRPGRDAIRARSGGLFAEHYHLFRGTPSRLWLDWVFAEVFGLDVRLDADTADHYYDTIDAALKRPAFPPARPVRALQHRGDRDDRKPARSARPSPRDPRQRLEGPGHHRLSPRSGGRSRDRRLRRQSRAASARSAGEDIGSLAGYLRAHREPPRASSARPARPRPTTATRAPAPPTCRAPRPRRCSRRIAAGRVHRRPRPSCSAARC